MFRRGDCTGALIELNADHGGVAGPVEAVIDVEGLEERQHGRVVASVQRKAATRSYHRAICRREAKEKGKQTTDLQRGQRQSQPSYPGQMTYKIPISQYKESGSLQNQSSTPWTWWPSWYQGETSSSSASCRCKWHRPWPHCTAAA